MRISGGQWRGRSILTPKGEQTRPTSGRVREALFNIIGHDFSGLRVLDLFAGSGALGLEALSRGAEHGSFVENHMNALKALNANISALDCRDQTTVYSHSAAAMIPKLQGTQFDFIVADPPYDLQIQNIYAGEWVFYSVIEHKLLSPNGILVIEARQDPSDSLKDQLDVRRYGDTCLWIFKPTSRGI